MSIHDGGNVAGVQGAGLLGGEAQAEAFSVAPSSNGQAHLGTVVEHGPDVGQVHERGVGAHGVGGEDRRVGKSRDDMSDAGSQRLVGQNCRVVPVSSCQHHNHHY